MFICDIFLSGCLSQKTGVLDVSNNEVLEEQETNKAVEIEGVTAGRFNGAVEIEGVTAGRFNGAVEIEGLTNGRRNIDHIGQYNW